MRIIISHFRFILVSLKIFGEIVMPWGQWCRSLLSIGGDNLQFYPNFALFSTLGGMNLDHEFGNLVKTKKMQMEHCFPRIQVKTKKKGLH